jgi:hypothetical protein
MFDSNTTSLRIPDLYSVPIILPTCPCLVSQGPLSEPTVWCRELENINYASAVPIDNGRKAFCWDRTAQSGIWLTERSDMPFGGWPNWQSPTRKSRSFGPAISRHNSLIADVIGSAGGLLPVWPDPGRSEGAGLPSGQPMAEPTPPPLLHEGWGEYSTINNSLSYEDPQHAESSRPKQRYVEFLTPSLI